MSWPCLSWMTWVSPRTSSVLHSFLSQMGRQMKTVKGTSSVPGAGAHKLGGGGGLGEGERTQRVGGGAAGGLISTFHPKTPLGGGGELPRAGDGTLQEMASRGRCGAAPHCRKQGDLTGIPSKAESGVLPVLPWAASPRNRSQSGLLRPGRTLLNRPETSNTPMLSTTQGHGHSSWAHMSVSSVWAKTTLNMHTHVCTQKTTYDMHKYTCTLYVCRDNPLSQVTKSVFSQ